MHAFKVGHFRRIAGFRQGFKAVLHQVHQTAAQDVLFTEQVFISFLGHGAFQHAAAGQAFSLGHGKSHVTGLAGGVLMNGNQAGAAEPFFKYSAHFRARALGGHHDDIYIRGGDDGIENIREAMGAAKRLAGLQVRLDFSFIHGAVAFIRQQNVNDVRFFGGFRDAHYLESILGGGVKRLAGANADNHVHTGITHAKCLSAPLGAISDHGNGLAVQCAEISGVVMNNIHCYSFFK